MENTMDKQNDKQQEQHVDEGAQVKNGRALTNL